MKLLFAALISCLIVSKVYCQAVPQIHNFQTSDYGADHQNWMITQGCNGHIYIANSAGILIYNGMKWQTIKTPRNQITRSIYTGIDCKIYAGGYEYFGYIDMSDKHRPAFINICDSLLSGTNQEIWNIIGKRDTVIFQSFSNLYSLHKNVLKEIPVPSNIMLGNNVVGKVYIPKIENGLYQLSGDTLQNVRGSEKLPEKCQIAGITSWDKKSKLLVATQYQGLYTFDNRVTKIDSKLNNNLQKEQVNKVLALDNGDIAIGTILNGVYILDAKLNIKHHINKENGLSNNTVLSLFQDNNSDLWIGLDNGINVLKLSSKNRLFYDRKGVLGTVYTSIVYKDQLYLGTNQGLVKQKNDGTFLLINNSQGQVWSLLSIDGDLLIGHNNGTFQLIKDSAVKVSSETGGWHMAKLPNGEVLQTTYTGLIVLRKIKNRWSLKHKLKGGSIQISNFTIDGTRLLGNYSAYGISLIQFNTNFTEVVSEKKIETVDKNTITNDAILNAIGEPQSFTINGLLYEIDADGEPKRNDDKIQFQNTIEYVATISMINKQYATTNTNYINRACFESQYLIGIDEGYIIASKKTENTIGNMPDIEFITANEIDITSSNSPLKPTENYIQVQLQDTTLSKSYDKMKYQLKGWDEIAYPIPKDGNIIFRNLDNNTYTLSIIDDKKNTHELIEFEISPHWYESWQGAILYIILGLLTLWIFNILNRNRHLTQQAELIRKQEKELESTRIKARNETLENEILFKSKMLANSTITLVQKNEMLSKMRDLISKQGDKANNFNQLKLKLYKLIDRNINNDENWQIFEKNFAAVHENFLDNLKAQCPTITTGELRLAAYIKMNLGSKEIAPLLNISVRSIENKRYRLRKKLGINHETTLKEHLLSL